MGIRVQTTAARPATALRAVIMAGGWRKEEKIGTPVFSSKKPFGSEALVRQ